MSSNESRSPPSSIRGGSSAGSVRGRGGGGFVPKKKLYAQMQSMELSSSDSSNVLKDKFQIPAAKDSDESDTTDSETEQTKRCDFCGDMNHQNRSCPLLQVQDNPFSLDEPGKSANKSNTCYHCKQEGHFKADCPKLKVLLKTCYYCKKEGHFKSDCTEKALREAKKRERELTLNYTFRKTSSQKETTTSPTLSTNTAVDVFYEGPTAKERDEENSATPVESKEEEASAPPPRVFVPFPVKASQLKSEVKLRAKLGSTEIVRSESSEEEDRESVESDNDDSKENNSLAKDQQTPKANEGEEGEFQTIGIKVDGCVEFDSGDDRSYYDCSDGEEPNAGNGNGRKRMLEEPDELYGEDGALIYDDEEPATKMEEDDKNNDDEEKKEEKE